MRPCIHASQQEEQYFQSFVGGLEVTVLEPLAGTVAFHLVFILMTDKQGHVTILHDFSGILIVEFQHH